VNFLEMIGWFLAGKAGDLAVAGRDLVVNLKRLAVAVVIVPLLVIGTGLWLGYNADLEADMLNARAAGMTVAIGAVIGCVATAFLWIRLASLLYLTWLGTTSARQVSDKVPVLARSDAEKTSLWIRTVMAWVCGGFVLALFLNRSDPLWRHHGQFTCLFACGLVLMMAAEWTKKKWSRVVAMVGVVGLFVTTTLSYISPTFAGHCDSFNRRFLGSSEYSVLMAAEKRGAVELNKQRLAMLVKEQNEIRQRGFENCSGNFCPGDLAKFQANQTEIAALNDGTYWEKKAMVTKPAPAAPETVNQPTALSKTKTSAPVQAKDDSAWSELDQYADL
jgi:hypothetical protein